MENFFIQADKYIPGILFDAETGVFEITGQSYHEFTEKFFEPMFTWLETYFETPGKSVTFNFKLSYFNTATSKCFLDLFNMLEEYVEHKEGKVKVQWFYQDEDEDMMAIGEDFAFDTSLPVELISFG